MRENRLLITLICAGIAIVAAAVLFFAFKVQIMGFFSELKGRVEERRCLRRGEYANYADM